MKLSEKPLGEQPPLVIDAYCTLGVESDESLGVEALLASMERLHVAQSLIAPDSRELAVQNRSGNSRISALARKYPDKLVAAFSVNPWRKNAILLAQQAREEGGRVLILAPHRQGCHLGDSLWDPLLEWAGISNIPVYAHASPTASGTPGQLYFLAERHPRVRFLLGRGGTSDYAADMRPLLDLAPENLWYDFGFVRPSVMASYAKAAPSRFCFASCAPQNDPALELNLLRTHIPAELFPGVLGENFKTFLNS